MSYADQIFIQNCNDILEHGVWDTDYDVRPVWEDGTPAHTIKRFGIVNRYDLTREFPVITLRRTAFKSAVDELLWIWQKKSNNIHDLNSHIWDSWADENGSIGKAYGYQLGVKHHYKEGDFDQVDRILYDLKHNPLSRRIMSNIYNHHDLCEMNLYPCAYKPALPGHADSQQLERMPVRGPAPHAGAGKRPETRRIGPCYCRRPYLRPAYTDGGGVAETGALPRSNPVHGHFHPEFLSVHH